MFGLMSSMLISQAFSGDKTIYFKCSRNNVNMLCSVSFVAGVVDCGHFSLCWLSADREEERQGKDWERDRERGGENKAAMQTSSHTQKAMQHLTHSETRWNLNLYFTVSESSTQNIWCHFNGCPVTRDHHEDCYWFLWWRSNDVMCMSSLSTCYLGWDECWEVMWHRSV